MRYYNISITNPKTGAQVMPSSLATGGATSGAFQTPKTSGRLGITSLLPSGQSNPAALNIEFDIPAVGYAEPGPAAFLRIWGLGLKDIGAAFNLNGMNIAISAGMAAGLPLANPKQQGLILRGQILQAFGNWIGLEQTIDMNFLPGTGSPTDPQNFPFNWLKGTKLAAALAQTLTAAQPTWKQTIQISDKLVLNHDEWGYYQSAQQFGDFIKKLSKDIIKTAGYPGVVISSDGNTWTARDDTVAPSGEVLEISFRDLLGQPTWLGPSKISFKCVLRGDLVLMQRIKLPQGLISQTNASQLRFMDKTAFNGEYTIDYIQHYGNFRQPDAMSWNTTVQCFPTQGGDPNAPPPTPSNT